MTFLQKLQTHKGCLLRLKTQLYWYGKRGYDNTPGRVCLILDAATCQVTATTATTTSVMSKTPAAAFLLVDGSPHWIWIAKEDVELL
jgi:hypothetical protein